jgi:hypothetical protein
VGVCYSVVRVSLTHVRARTDADFAPRGAACEAAGRSALGARGGAAPAGCRRTAHRQPWRPTRR